MTKRVLFIGCGDLGIRTAQTLGARGYHVAGARRNPASLPATIEKFTLDVTDPQSFSQFDATQWDAIIVSLTARGEAAYQAVYVGGMINLLQSVSSMQGAPLVLFVSSTSVYHQDDGAVVDEMSPTLPLGYSGRTMLEVEALLAASDLPHTSVRFSGIYGVSDSSSGLRGGHLHQVLREGRIAPQTPERFSNRIHIDDCVGVLDFLLQRYFSGKELSPVYLGSDGQPAALAEVMHWLAHQTGIDTGSLIEDYRPARGGNKRCIGKLLLEQGYQFCVRDYRQGYGG